MKDHESTDEESAGVQDVEEMLRRTDIRTVASKDSGQGFETSFLIVARSNSNRSENRSVDEGDISESSTWRGTWLCRPYKRERLLEEIYAANRKGIAGHAAVLNTLKNTGTMIFIIDSKVSTTTADVLDSVRNVVYHVAKEERMRPQFNPKTDQRCLLYRDHEGRFFNLTMADHTTSSAGQWEHTMKSFSVVQAMSVLVVLSRSFACGTEFSTFAPEFRPGYLALLLGLVFHEEISYSWTNVGMFVRGMPSYSAYSVTSEVESDWVRKALLLSLALSSVSSGKTQMVLLLFGISLTCAVVLANLGARTWNFMQWRPIGNWGVFEPTVAFLAAITTGIFLPYLGHRQIESGGKGAMESVIRIGFMVAAVFIASDFDDFQKFLVVGSENCSQGIVNICVGGWFILSLVSCLLVVLRKDREGIWPEDEEPLLEKDHSSPVGFKVPNLPDFPVDPTLAVRGIPVVNIQVEFFLGTIMALVLGGGIIFMASSSFDDNLTGSN